MALVIVLFTLVIVTALVVSFLMAVQTEVRSAASYQATAVTQQLSDTAVNMVTAEISAATSQQAPNAWASQPGAIWVFGSGGTPTAIYRLYSWPSLTAANGTSLLADTSQMASWASSPALWVDLNAESPSGRYPIIDPGPSPNTLVDGFSIGTLPSGGTSSSLPMPVQWLYVLQNGAVAAPTKIDGNTVTVTGASTVNPIIGRIAYWTDDETSKVNVNTAGGDDGGAVPTVTAGTVGSSFYANNANATFWDTPHFNSSDDITLGNNQAVRGEFQRYPGHPATTALNYLLSSLMGSTLTSSNFFTLTPRYSLGGSQGGTVAITPTEAAIPLKADRLYASVEDMLFSSTNRAPSAIVSAQTAASSSAMERSRFFLTAHSVAPEVNLYGLPRISMWPIWDETGGSSTWTSWPASAPVPSGDAQHMTVYDQTLAHCSTLIFGNNAYPYYFTRANNTNVYGPLAGNGQYTLDVSIARNQKLLGYLDTMLTNQVPGFTGTFSSPTGASKWNSNVNSQVEMRQVLTEMFDYIRTVNSMDPNLPANSLGYNTTIFAAGTPGSGNVVGGGFSMGMAQVAPTEIITVPGSGSTSINGKVWGTQGYGVFPKLVEADLQFVALGAGTNAIAATSLPQTNGLVPVAVFADQVGNRVNTSTGTFMASNVPSTNCVAVQSYLLLNFLTPAHQLPWTRYEPVFFADVSGLNAFQLNNTQLFSIPNNDDAAVGGGIKLETIEGSAMAGYLDFRSMIAARSLGPGWDNGNNTGNYPFYSNILALTNAAPGSTTMAFTGGPITITIYAPVNTSYATHAGPIEGDPVQKYIINFQSATFPAPTLPVFRRIGSTLPATNGGPGEVAVTNATMYSDRWRDIESDSVGGNAGELAAYVQAGNNVNYYVTNTPPTTATGWGGSDVVEGMVLSPKYSDARMLAVTNVPSAAFIPHPNYGVLTTNLAYGVSIPATAAPGAGVGALAAGANYGNGTQNPQPIVSPWTTSSTGATNQAAQQGDWDNGISWYSDGPYINKADEGNAAQANVPYFTYNQSTNSPPYFSPNRQMPSPAMFGSLPTGVDPSGNNPAGWQTLLFRPPPTGTLPHPGAIAPEDELLLDLFWMPVTDPYPISEAFSTLGKVNLNYEIVPFTYINRSTALRAVLSSEKVTQVATSKASVYKTGWSPSNTLGGTARLSLNLGSDTSNDGGTLQQFRDMFTGAGNFFSGTPMVFHSAAQICDIYLVPQGFSWASTSAAQSAWYGSSFGLVGDNERERPYADIYGRVTTKSNTFKVHFTVQSIKPSPSDAAIGQWNESRGAVTGQYIGSSVIERYIDPSGSAIQDYASLSNPLSVPNLESSYRWRVVEQHQFVP